MSKDEFYRGISRPVNSKLQKIFGQLGFVEQTGHGVPLIVSNYGKQAFEVMDNYVNVIIPFTRNKEIEEMSNVTNSLNEAQMKIYELLKDNPNNTIKDLVRLSGFSDGYVRKILSQLKAGNYVIRRGSNKTGYWEIV